MNSNTLSAFKSKYSTVRFTLITGKGWKIRNSDLENASYDFAENLEITNFDLRKSIGTISLSRKIRIFGVNGRVWKGVTCTALTNNRKLPILVPNS
mgnify:CR=1 FL=1